MKTSYLVCPPPCTHNQDAKGHAQHGTFCMKVLNIQNNTTHDYG